MPWASGLRLLVENQDGRPTKIEGLPTNAAAAGKMTADDIAAGAADSWAQAELLNLYDPERSSSPASFDAKGKRIDVSWADAYKSFDASMAAARKKSGKALQSLSTR